MFPVVTRCLWGIAVRFPQSTTCLLWPLSWKVFVFPLCVITLSESRTFGSFSGTKRPWTGHARRRYVNSKAAKKDRWRGSKAMYDVEMTPVRPTQQGRCDVYPLNVHLLAIESLATVPSSPRTFFFFLPKGATVAQCSQQMTGPPSGTFVPGLSSLLLPTEALDCSQTRLPRASLETGSHSISRHSGTFSFSPVGLQPTHDQHTCPTDVPPVPTPSSTLPSRGAIEREEKLRWPSSTDTDRLRFPTASLFAPSPPPWGRLRASPPDPSTPPPAFPSSIPRGPRRSHPYKIDESPPVRPFPSTLLVLPSPRRRLPVFLHQLLLDIPGHGEVCLVLHRELA